MSKSLGEVVVVADSIVVVALVVDGASIAVWGKNKPFNASLSAGPSCTIV